MKHIAVLLTVFGIAAAQGIELGSHNAGRTTAETFVVGEAIAGELVRDVRIAVTFLNAAGDAIDTREAPGLVRTVAAGEATPFIATTRVEGATRYRVSVSALPAEALHPRLDVVESHLTPDGVSGRVTNPHARDVVSVKVTVAGYAGSEVVAAGFTYTSDLPPNGEAGFTVPLTYQDADVETYRVWAEGR